MTLKGTKPFNRTLVVAVTLIVAVSLAMTAALGVWAGHRIDGQSIDRQHRLAASALADTMARIVVEQETSTIWDDAVLGVRANDGDWLSENLVDWVSDYFGHDRVFVLDSELQLVRAAQYGQRADSNLYRQDALILEPLIRRLKSELAVASEGLQDSTEAITGMGVLDIVTLSDGQPAIVSMRPVVPSSDRIYQAPGTEALHISIVILDEEPLLHMGDKFELHGLGLSFSSTSVAALPLTDSAGNEHGYLTWEPDRPAARLLIGTAPAILGLLVGCALLLAWLLRHLGRTSGQLVASEAHARYLAFHDPLTGLPNRALFEDRLAQTIASTEDTGALFALHYVDLDNFKHVNDTLGHPTGDQLIRAVAARLIEAVRDVDTVARIGGDEFAIIQYRVRSESDAEAFAGRVLGALTRPFDVGGELLNVNASIGTAAARYPAVPEDLMRKADIALYQSKDTGRGKATLFQGDMDDLVKERRALERDLRRALLEGEDLYIDYQPIFDGEGTLRGAEALARWKRNGTTMVAPELFVRIAEERGMIDQLGTWVLKCAATLLSTSEIPWIAVNVSPLQCQDPSLARRILALLDGLNVDPGRLQIEVTEGVLLENSSIVRNNLAQLRSAGVLIALDDFGTGYSSISYLREYGIDKLKIDQSYVWQMVDNTEMGKIVSAIMNLAQALDMSVTMEGVETTEQFRMGIQLNADEFQGYLFARPSSEHALLFEGMQPAFLQKC